MERAWRMYLFKYLGCGIGYAEGYKEMASGKTVADAMRSLLNVKGLQIECAKNLHEALIVLVLL